MKIVRLTLDNFGIYAQSNTLDLTSSKPVILIGGMNGRGKTTILEAVLLALYGRRSFAFEESSRAFPKYLTGLVNRADGTLKTGIGLEFELPAENGSDRYMVRREWSLKTVAPAFKTTVEKNGIYDPILSENWDMFVEEVLPAAIAPFFFFDGEKIAELAVSDDDLQMKNSIKALLGINIIDQAVADARRVIRSKKKNVASDTFSNEIKELETEIGKIEDLLKDSAKECGHLTNKQKRLERKLRDAENAFVSAGGSLAGNRKDTTDRLRFLNERLERVNLRLLEIAAGDIPLLMTVPLLRSISGGAECEREQRGIRAALAQLPVLFKQYGKDGPLAKNFNDFLNFVKSSATGSEPVYDLTENGYLQLKMLLTSLLAGQKQESERLLLEREELVKQKTEIENHLSLPVDENEAGRRYKDTLSLTAELAALSEQLRAAKAKEPAYQARHDELKRRQLKAIEKAVDNLEGADDLKRIVAYAGYTIEVLCEYKKRLQAAKTKQLAQTMTDCFKRIASKQNLIHRIHIDESNLNFHYYNGDQAEVNRSALSAGEKQLLVIAMLWALGICAKKQFPIIIDTPLARLDSAHRETLITNYLPCASEQTVLLSTDAEVHGRYYDLLRPFVDREYTLIYDDAAKRSSVRAGYFGGEAR